jgi:hypothetical protein
LLGSFCKAALRSTQLHSCVNLACCSALWTRLLFNNAFPESNIVELEGVHTTKQWNLNQIAEKTPWKCFQGNLLLQLNQTKPNQTNNVMKLYEAEHFSYPRWGTPIAADYSRQRADFRYES